MDISPSVYEHAAFLIGRTPWEASRNGDLIFEAHAEAYRRYRQTPIMPGIDIYNLEAEAYGGVVEKPGGVGVPAIKKPILGSAYELTTLRPLDPQRDGRIPVIVDDMLSTGTGYLVCPFETDQEAFMRKVWDRTDVRIRINSDVELISRGAWEQIRADADRIIRLAEGRENVCMGTGALPYETPPENVLMLMDYVRRR